MHTMCSPLDLILLARSLTRRMVAFQWISADWASVVAPRGCFADYEARLYLQAFVPLGLLVMYAGSVVLGQMIAARRREPTLGVDGSSPNATPALNTTPLPAPDHAVSIDAPVPNSKASTDLSSKRPSVKFDANVHIRVHEPMPKKAESTIVSLKSSVDGAVSNLEASRRGMLSSLAYILVALFALVPFVSMRIFSVFSCEHFHYEPGSTKGFLSSDYSVECGSHEHSRLVAGAIGLVFLWPIGVPAFFCALLFAAHSRKERGSMELFRAVSFLHGEYKDEFFFWELIELARKLLLAGFVFLIPHSYTMLRIVLAILISIAHAVVLQSAQPYKERSTSILAIAISLTLQFTLLTAMLALTFHRLPSDVAQTLFGFDDVLPLAVVILIFNFGVFFTTVAFLRAESQLRGQYVFRLQKRVGSLRAGAAPTLPRLGDDESHLFLSHSWPNQSVAASIKHRLQQLLPGVCVFSA